MSSAGIRVATHQHGDVGLGSIVIAHLFAPRQIGQRDGSGAGS